MRAGRKRFRLHQTGFAYLWLLAAIAVVAVGMSLVGPLWAEHVQREREAELLRVGTAYARAVEHYYRMQPAGVRQLPHTVNDLLLDPRFLPVVVRHLRQAYTDPMQPGQPLSPLFGPTGGLRGVSSSSDARPLRQAPWTDGQFSLPAASAATRYRDWQFLADISS